MLANSCHCSGASSCTRLGMSIAAGAFSNSNTPTIPFRCSCLSSVCIQNSSMPTLSYSNPFSYVYLFSSSASHPWAVTMTAKRSPSSAAGGERLRRRSGSGYIGLYIYYSTLRSMANPHLPVTNNDLVKHRLERWYRWFRKFRARYRISWVLTL